MKLILKEDVNGLGYKDDVVEVKNGYGRNYLIPTGKAIIATESALKVLAENQRQRAHKLAKIKADAEAAAAALEGINVVIAAKAAENGAIYGSVGAAHIAEALEKLGHNVDRKIIEVVPVKVLGSHSAKVRFHREVIFELPFEVIAEVEEA